MFSPGVFSVYLHFCPFIFIFLLIPSKFYTITQVAVQYVKVQCSYFEACVSYFIGHRLGLHDIQSLGRLMICVDVLISFRHSKVLFFFRAVWTVEFGIDLYANMSQ